MLLTITRTLLAALAISVALPAGAQERLTMEALKEADYMRGKQAFQGRCSACHTLGDDSGDIVGPNLWGVFDRVAGSHEGFGFSDTLVGADFQWSPDRLDAWLADPQGYLPGNIMGIPEAVPADDRPALISFMLIETGAVDWPRPETAFSAAQKDKSRPPAERFPSFWNHLMFNTTRYRWVDTNSGEEFKFDVYFQADGLVTSSEKGVSGFWRIDERDFFCYALKGMKLSPVNHMVECFPVVAMAIPRFREELWTSNPQPNVDLIGGIVPGRPDWAMIGEPTVN